jgi:hypothetical protein
MSASGTKQTSGLAQPTSDFKRTVDIHPTFIRRCEMSDDEPKRILDKHTGALFLSGSKIFLARYMDARMVVGVSLRAYRVVRRISW